MRVCVMVCLLLAGSADAAFAQMAPVAPYASGAVVLAQAGPGTAEKTGRPGAKSLPADGDKSAASGATDSLTSCLAMWERATHMSRQEWARACRRVDERLRNISVK